MEIEKLNDWNHWWRDISLLKEFKGNSRPLYKDLVESTKIKEITIITGVRRSGKSTLMYQMISNLLNENVKPNQILLINLEDQRLKDDSLEEIYLSYRTNKNPDQKAYIFIDEVHKKEGWETWIRTKYDLKTEDKFIISSSSSYLLKKEYSTLLTGRNIQFEVFPLSFEELLNFNNIVIKPNDVDTKTKIKILNLMNEYIKMGGFPEVLLKPEQYKLKLLEQYFEDILYKDIIDRYNINSQKVKDLALLLMTNFTGMISLRNIRNSLGLSYDSIKDYIEYFKEAFLFFVLDHFSYSFKEQKTLPSKIYCIDNGLRNAVSFKFSEDVGKLVENLVHNEMKRRGLDLYYWSSKEEVDFIVKKKNQKITAINVTYTNDIDEREIKSLLSFNKIYDQTEELILITKDVDKVKNGIKYIPLWKWLLENG